MAAIDDGSIIIFTRKPEEENSTQEPTDLAKKLVKEKLQLARKVGWLQIQKNISMLLASEVAVSPSQKVHDFLLH